MLVLLAAAAIAGLTAPTPVNDADEVSWITRRDWKAHRDIASGWVNLTLVVDADGRVAACQASQGTGTTPQASAALVTTTCALIRQRAIFKPARDEKGRPSYGVFKTIQYWTFVDPPLPPPADYTLHDAARVGAYDVTALVEADGTLSACVTREAFLETSVATSIGCDELSKLWRPLPVGGADGKPVRSVQKALIDVEPK